MYPRQSRYEKVWLQDAEDMVFDCSLSAPSVTPTLMPEVKLSLPCYQGTEIWNILRRMVHEAVSS